MADSVLACPLCGASGPNKIGANSVRRSDDDEQSDWWCGECNTHIDEPDRRPPRRSGDSRFGLSKRLAEADPDAVGGD